MFLTRKSIKVIKKKKNILHTWPLWLFYFIPFILPSSCPPPPPTPSSSSSSSSFHFHVSKKNTQRNNMASFNVDINKIMKLEKKIQEMESTLPGLKAELKELKEGIGSMSSSSGESKTEAPASTTEVSFVSRGFYFVDYFFFLCDFYCCCCCCSSCCLSVVLRGVALLQLFVCVHMCVFELLCVSVCVVFWLFW